MFIQGKNGNNMILTFFNLPRFRRKQAAYGKHGICWCLHITKEKKEKKKNGGGGEFGFGHIWQVAGSYIQRVLGD